MEGEDEIGIGLSAIEIIATKQIPKQTIILHNKYAQLENLEYCDNTNGDSSTEDDNGNGHPIIADGIVQGCHLSPCRTIGATAGTIAQGCHFSPCR